MSARAVKTLTAYEFQRDFAAPAPAEPDTVTVSAAELSALLADAHEAGAKAAQGEMLARHTTDIEAIARDLSIAMAELTGLARHLETLGLGAAPLASVQSRIDLVCARILDRQGDLFESEG